MKIALINENSQAAKNALIEAALRKTVEPMGHTVVNYGMYTMEDKAQLTYVQVGILAAVLLGSGAADYVITGCGTGEGAMLACNSFPGVICGHVEDALDAYTFAQINPLPKASAGAASSILNTSSRSSFPSRAAADIPKSVPCPNSATRKFWTACARLHTGRCPTFCVHSTRLSFAAPSRASASWSISPATVRTKSFRNLSAIS